MSKRLLGEFRATYLDSIQRGEVSPEAVALLEKRLASPAEKIEVWEFLIKQIDINSALVSFLLDSPIAINTDRTKLNHILDQQGSLIKLLQDILTPDRRAARK